jgi:copper chaperone CopZ
MKQISIMAMTFTAGAMIALGGFSVAHACPGSAKTAQSCPTSGKTSALKAPVKPGFETVVLNVTNMTSNESVDKVTKSLTAISGVDEVAADASACCVTVAYDPSKTKPDQFVPAVTKAGYSAKLAVMEDKVMTAKAADMGEKAGGSCENKAEAMAPAR